MKIIIAGDFCPHHRTEELINKRNYSNIVSEEVKEIFYNSDLSIVNLECPITEGTISSMSKVGPSIKANKNSLSFLKYLGVNAVTLSNNHIMDFGAKGLESTITGCSAYSIRSFGAGMNIEQARIPLVVKSEKQNVAIINISENEFATTHGKAPGANPLDLVNNYHDIIDAKKNNDYVIVIYHGGHEGYKYPSPRMKKVFRYFVDVGADLVVCHHSHCYSGHEIYNNKNIFYGLGNFIFDWPGYHKKPWNYGYFLQVDTMSNNITIHPYIQSSENPTLRLLENQEKTDFLEDLTKINVVIKDDAELLEKFDQLVLERERSYLSLLQPYPGYLLGGAYRRGVLPSLLNKNKALKYLNAFRCEAHRDLQIKSIEKKFLL